jgi:hypothetical protein
LEDFTIEFDGKSYTGRRLVTGSRVLSQTIFFAGNSKDDGHPYKSNEETLMRLVARSILRELVEEELRESNKS